jgi:hypothetical protein
LDLLRLAWVFNKEGMMERERDSQMPSADVHNAYSWLAVGVAVGSGVGVAVGHIALGVGVGLALGAVGAILSKRGDNNRSGQG